MRTLGTAEHAIDLDIAKAAQPGFSGFPVLASRWSSGGGCILKPEGF